eukprot:scpid99855/ scgid30081/ 
MKAVSEKLGMDVCKALPALHAFTGCDTTSAFAYRGKKAALSIVQGDTVAGAAAREVFTSVGKQFQSLSTESLAALEKFVCAYYKVPHCSSVNSARYELFCTRNAQSNQLPPCRDALVKHSARANYQAAIWRRCLEPCPVIPLPHENGHGWCLTGD